MNHGTLRHAPEVSSQMSSVHGSPSSQRSTRIGEHTPSTQVDAAHGDEGQSAEESHAPGTALPPPPAAAPADAKPSFDSGTSLREPQAPRITPPHRTSTGNAIDEPERARNANVGAVLPRSTDGDGDGQSRCATPETRQASAPNGAVRPTDPPLDITSTLQIRPRRWQNR